MKEPTVKEPWPDIITLPEELRAEILLLPQEKHWVAVKRRYGQLEHIFCGELGSKQFRAERVVPLGTQPMAWLEAVLEAMVTPLRNLKPYRPESVAFSYREVALKLAPVLATIGVGVERVSDIIPYVQVPRQAPFLPAAPSST